tara:strand:+ start:2776 stop:5418 length:2643 start_codon:yes stop_codon:yes gene_type:complete
MRIKKLLKNSFIFFSPFIFILFILFCINILIKDFNYGHKSYNVDAKSINWISYFYSLNKKKLRNYFVNFYKKDKNEAGLPIVEIDISEKSLNKLLSDVPSSTKKYVNADLKIDKIKQDVDMRYIGDNPINWMFHQKAIRVKTKKSEIIDGKRYFEYKPSQRRLLDDYIAYIFAKKLDLLVSDVRLVEVFINNKSSGIFIERERLNESFLRRKKIMPVNLYKGEASRNSEKKIGLSVNLDENPGLWEKISILNTVKLGDHNDLENFTKKIREAGNSNEKLKNLFKYGNDQLLAKTAILEILLNQEINDNTHNRRLVIDVWSGKKYIIPHDFSYNRIKIDKENFNLDFCSTSLFCILNQSSDFLDIKYDILYKVIKEEKIFDEIINHLEDIRTNFLISQKTDLGTIFRKNVLIRDFSGVENEESFNQLIVSLKAREKKLIEILENKTISYWKKNPKGFEIIVDKSLPVSDVLVKFGSQKPEWIILDYNNNKIIDKNDIYFYSDKNKNFKLNLRLFANRILLNKEKLFNRSKIVTGKTSFSFFVDKSLIPNHLTTFNRFTGKGTSIKHNAINSNYPSLHNKVIVKTAKESKTLSGNIFLKENLILSDEIQILEGTTFNMAEGVSIVFENKVTAIGSIQNPIIFKKISNSKDWGTIAFHGKKTDGSILKNIIIENGSGKSIDGINYFSALSVHSAKNILFDNILIKDNSKYDDMMHIIYSKNIQVINSNFLNAHLDSIDVDISKNIFFENTNIINSGNDGIDFMESSAYLDKVKLISSRDKGISVGENSNIIIKNSKFENNKYGIASKDSSKAIVENSEFNENKIQLSTYKKNWRYGGSGFIEIKKSNFTALNNDLISDGKGEIFIISSTFNGKILKSGNVNIY